MDEPPELTAEDEEEYLQEQAEEFGFQEEPPEDVGGGFVPEDGAHRYTLKSPPIAIIQAVLSLASRFSVSLHVLSA